MTGRAIASRISRVLDDEGLLARLGAGARAWAEQNLTWEATLDRFDELYRRLLGT